MNRIYSEAAYGARLSILAISMAFAMSVQAIMYDIEATPDPGDASWVSGFRIRFDDINANSRLDIDEVISFSGVTFTSSAPTVKTYFLNEVVSIPVVYDSSASQQLTNFGQTTSTCYDPGGLGAWVFVNCGYPPDEQAWNFSQFVWYYALTSPFPELDWKSSGDKRISLDKITGLEWLDITETTNQSYNYISSQFSIGGGYQGFRYATTEEVKEFITNAGWSAFGSLMFNPDAYEPLSLVQSLVGITNDLGFMRETHGITQDHDDLYGVSVYVSTTDQTGLTLLGGGWDETFVDPTLGSWLVRSHLNEPRDLNNDSRGDIVLRNMDTGFVYMWAMNGNLKTRFDIGTLPLNREVLGISDLTGDRKADIILRNMDTGYLYMWAMDGNLKTYYGISSLPLNHAVVGIADLTGDGKADIILRNMDTGFVYMWAMDGNLKTRFDIGALPLNREVVGISDLTGDRKADIILRNMDTGFIYMWAMNGHLKIRYDIGALPLNREVVGISDLTGDRKADIILRNMDTGFVYIWAMDGNSKTYYGISALPLNHDVVEIADLTGDGKSDIILRNIDTGFVYMWAMNDNLKTRFDIGDLPLNRTVQPSPILMQ